MASPIDFKSTTAHSDQVSFSTGGNAGITLGLGARQSSAWLWGALGAAAILGGVWLLKRRKGG